MGDVRILRLDTMLKSHCETRRLYYLFDIKHTEWPKLIKLLLFDVLHFQTFCEFLKQQSPELITFKVPLIIRKINICISRPRNHSLTYREKNCRPGRLRPRLDNLEAKVYTTFFVQLNYIL
jgi:hypothetical protein